MHGVVFPPVTIVLIIQHIELVEVSVAFVLVCLCAGVAYLNLRSHQGSSCSQDINYTCCHDLYVGMGRRQEEGRERERERLLMSWEPKRNQHNLLNKIRDS